MRLPGAVAGGYNALDHPSSNLEPTVESALAVASMTGFARHQGPFPDPPGGGFIWELRSVNGRGLDPRARLPAGWDELDGPVRQAVGRVLTRGNVSLTLTLEGPRVGTAPVLNDALLDRLAEAAETVAKRHPGLAPARIDGLMALRGVLESGESGESTDPGIVREARAVRRGAILAGLETTLTDLAAARAAEGNRLEAVLRSLLDRIETLRARAADLAETQPKALRERFRAQVATLLEALQDLPGPRAEDRFYQEAAILVAKADVREELDRLAAHVAAARDLLDGGGAIGRKLDFLCQEFNREANTLCSKASDGALTSVGLELKATIDQMREQVQNVE